MRIIKNCDHNEVEIESDFAITYPLPKNLKKIVDFIRKIPLSEYGIEQLELSTDPIQIKVSKLHQIMIFSRTNYYTKLDNSIKKIITWMLNNFSNSCIRKLEIAETSISILIISSNSTHILTTKNSMFHTIMDKLHIYKYLILYNLNEEEMCIIKDQFDKYIDLIYYMYPIIIHKNEQGNIVIDKYTKVCRTIKDIRELDLIPYMIETNILDEKLEETVCNFIKMQLL